MGAKNAKAGPDIARMRELVSYDQETGLFTWLVWRPNGVKVGHVAGRLNKFGYRVISLDGRSYFAHRLAWLWMTGLWPVDEIDHSNAIKDDNRWINLRAATASQNAGNRRAYANNTSGLKGVSWVVSRRKFIASIGLNGKRKNLGRFDCPAAAHFAYIVAADKHFGEFSRGA
jgi:hypothetical protein